MEGTKVLSALLPVAIALAAEATNADAQITPTEGLESRFSAQTDWVTVSVENPNWTEVRVYVAVRGGYVPIGTARRMTSTNFQIPRNLLRGASSVMLLAHPTEESRNTVVSRVRLTRGLATWSITGLTSGRLRRVQA